MDQRESAYIRLQKHLNRQPVGFPATRSGVELRILKHIFTPFEAEITTYLTYRLEPLLAIFDRVRHRVPSLQELEALLDGIRKKGGIEFKEKQGEKHYCCVPLVLGMYELQLGRLTPEFIEDFNRYTANIKFGIEFISTELPQMRTIPVSKSIRPLHHVSTFDEVAALLQQAEEPFVILPCICRTKRSMEGESCRLTDRKDTCMAMGGIGQMVLLNGFGRQISRSEAVEIIEENQKEGFVLQPSNTARADFICSCCSCCCGILGLHKNLPKPLDYWASNYRAVLDPTTCNECGICEARCQVGAVTVDEKRGHAGIDSNRCIGCGVCVADCPTESITLVKKPSEVKPPPTREDLYEIIMAKKKGRLGKLQLTGKLLVDALRAGRIDLFTGR